MKHIVKKLKERFEFECGLSRWFYIFAKCASVLCTIALGVGICEFRAGGIYLLAFSLFDLLLLRFCIAAYEIESEMNAE